MRLTSPFWDGNGEKNKIILFPLFGTVTGMTKKPSRYLGREQELLKSFLAIQDKNGKPKKVFQLFGNGNFRPSLLEMYRNKNFRLGSFSLFNWSSNKSERWVDSTLIFSCPDQL